MPLVAFGKFPQSITYWGSPVADGSGGMSFSAPVALDARWEEKVEQRHDEFDEEYISHARVYVQTNLNVGGYLLLGTSVASDPTVVTGAYKIREFLSTPNLPATKSERRAFL